MELINSMNQVALKRIFKYDSSGRKIELSENGDESIEIYNYDDNGN